MFNRFNINKCKTQAKLCIGRVRLMRNKRQIAMKQMRREVADLLRANKQENARIRVEAVIREQNMLQAYEVLEIFLELLTVRLQMVEKSTDVPNDMLECMASLVYAASRVQDFPELVSIRAMLGNKFGREFVEKASSDSSCRQFMVNENLIRCLAIGAPDPEVKLALLSDIAQEHGVEWDSHRAHQEMVVGASTRGYGGGSFTGSPGAPPPGTFGGPGGFRGGGGGGNLGFGAGPGPVYAPPPEGNFSPPPLASPGAPNGQSKLKNMLKKVPTLGKSSPANSAEGYAVSPSEEEWKDAHSAASAAREYSQKAQSAADAAQRYASSNASSTDLGVAETRQANLSPPPAGMPPNPDYPNIQVGQQGPPSFTPMSSNLPPTGQPGNPPPAQPVVPPTLPPGQYRKRSTEEIQQAYDAAVGPPTKGGVGPPSAPTAPPAPDVQDAPPLSQDKAVGSPPGADVSNGGLTNKRNSSGIDDDLAARFEALKRG